MLKKERKEKRPFVIEICRNKNGKERQVKRYFIKHICKTCGKKFWSKRKSVRFCNKKCVNHGTTKRSNGYLWLKRWEHPNHNGQGYVYYHRLAAEKKLGRYLDVWEVVHHIDMDKTNNHPDNLQVMGEHEHSKLHYILGEKWTMSRFMATDKEHCKLVRE